MTFLRRLQALSGDWHGSNTLHDPHTQKPETTPSTLHVAPFLQDRFVRLDYTWSYQGTPQEGSLLVGLDPTNGPSVAWIDTWHQGRAVMLLAGTSREDGFDVFGTFPAPPDPDWGWRMVLAASDDRIVLTMTCVPPGDAPPFPANDAAWTRRTP
jgi:hypothetical protein